MKLQFKIHEILVKSLHFIPYSMVLLLLARLAHINNSLYANSTISSKFIVFAYSCWIILAVYLLYMVSLKCRTITVYFGFIYTLRLEQGYKKWKDALTTYQYGDYKGSIQEYKTAYTIFNNNGEFLMNYGKVLSMEKQHTLSIQILEQATQTK